MLETETNFDYLARELHNVAHRMLVQLTSHVGCFDTMTQVRHAYNGTARKRRLAALNFEMPRDRASIRTALLEGKIMPLVPWDRAHRLPNASYWRDPEVVEELVTLAIQQLNAGGF